MAKRKRVTARMFTNISTDDAIVNVVADAGGGLDRRIVARRLGHRADFAAALLRLQRRGAIEVFGTKTPAGRTVWTVRLIGATAKEQGAGMVRVGGRR